jgi:hypothetical protein
MSRRRDEILRHRREEIRAAAARRNAVSISLIGSVARGEDVDDSDYDFLAVFAEGASLLDQARLINDLQDLLGSKVDVVSAGALTDRDDAIRHEAVLL